ncbi:MAG: FAD:protein FMN transferase, partial [Planctomycetes bacterium]|nr:FAD:protein FMN transferase [Planctomycetota bacterium]
MSSGVLATAESSSARALWPAAKMNTEANSTETTICRFRRKVNGMSLVIQSKKTRSSGKVSSGTGGSPSISFSTNRCHQQREFCIQYDHNGNWLKAVFCLLVFGFMFSTGWSQTLERFEYAEPHLGTLVEITLYAPTEQVANEAAEAAYGRIEELNRILSDYNPDSEVMRLCRTSGTQTQVAVSSELFELLSDSQNISDRTTGAFDITIGPLVRLWRKARKEKRLPDPMDLEQARRLVHWKNIKLDPQGKTVELTQAGMSIDFGGIAKGYIAEQARQVIINQKFPKCLVAVAGDIAVGDPPPNKEGWRIGIAPLEKPDGPPSRFVTLSNCSISTSGDAFQYIEIDGVRYSHIVDPTTGLGLTHRSSVTVIAKKGAIADGLATAITVMGKEKGLKLLEHFPNTEAYVVT